MTSKSLNKIDFGHGTGWNIHIYTEMNMTEFDIYYSS